MKKSRHFVEGLQCIPMADGVRLLASANLLTKITFYSINLSYKFQKSCVLRYEGGINTAGTYAVALTLEDFPAGTTDFNNVKPFSTVGLQFLAIISSHSGFCNNIPVFTGNTPQDGDCSEVQIGSVYVAVIQASVTDVSKQ